MSESMLLIVDDEAPIRSLVSFSLQRQPYKIVEADSAEAALRVIHCQVPDLILLDWMLPDMSGIDLIKKLRADKAYAQIPVIMLTARAEEENKLRGFKMGADDYVTKPFSPKELAARIDALLRRTHREQSDTVTVGGVTLDLVKHELTIDGKPVHIGRREYQLLSFLMQHTDRVFSRQQLLDFVWGREADVTERTVDVHVRRVRQILAAGNYENLIKTVRGSGYRFDSVYRD